MRQTTSRDRSRNTQDAPITLRKARFLRIKDLQPICSGFSVIGKVLEIREKLNRQNLDGTVLRVNEAIIGDETGIVTMSVRSALVDQIKQGETYVFRNAKVEMYRYFMRLAVDRWGLIEASDKKIKTVDETKDLSAIEYELVNPNTGNVNRNRRNAGQTNNNNPNTNKGNTNDNDNEDENVD